MAARIAVSGHHSRPAGLAKPPNEGRQHWYYESSPSQCDTNSLSQRKLGSNCASFPRRFAATSATGSSFSKMSSPGDVKKLEGQRSHYRRRAGSYRILFRLDGAKD